MTISDRPDPQAKPLAAAVRPVRPDGPAVEGERPAGSPPPPSESGDRVEISAAGRAQAATTSSEANADLDSARVALRSTADLDAARVASLRADVRAGRFDQPEVIARVAEAAVQNLTD
ncbi:hypothetical protein [Rubrivirga sp. IMCC45206]|uniref:hypothetical protein n=1 Tax=Rubrivirga sp. IMCC45206 TaxID=3391614 RepID=UPI00399023E3